MIKTCLFDMGNVLVFFSHERMCRQIGALCGWTRDECRKQLMDSGLQWNYERGLLTCEEMRDALGELSGRRISLAALDHATADIFIENSSMLPILARLKANGLRLVLLSNTSVSHVRFVERHFDVLNDFDHRVLSCEVGAIKPEAKIYEAALEAIHCPPEECFYTDDIAAYIEKGREFGLDAEIFTQTAVLKEHLHDRQIEGF